MNLTDQQKRMLDGEYGEPVRQGMELTVELGKFWGAESLIPVRSVHMPGVGVHSLRRAGMKYIRWAADQGARFVTTTSTNQASADLTGVEMGVSAETMRQQLEITDSFRRMGALICNTCTPWLAGNCPRVGEHVVWGESADIVYCNSVLGARTNREGGPSAMATALTGFTANYGMHLKENRLATLHVAIEGPLRDVSEFGCAAYYSSKKFPDAVPVFTGIPEGTPDYVLKEMGAALASSGSVALFHAVGLTPEAPTLEAATGGRKIESIKIGPKEIEETKAFLNRTNPSSEIDCAFIGCPHLDYSEIRILAGLLKGRKVKPGVRLWLFSGKGVWDLCQRSGMTEVLRESGAELISDTCPNVEEIKNMGVNGFKSAATDSTKFAHYLPSRGLNTHYGSTAEVIEAAVTGKWGV